MEFIAKHWGDLASVLGLVLTLLAIWFAWRAKAAAEEVRDRISRFDTISELSAAITIIEEIMRLQRTQAWEVVWDIVLDRHSILRGHLVRSQAGIESEGLRSAVRATIGHFRIMIEEIERARTEPEQSRLDTAAFNRRLSDQIETLEKVRIDVKKAESNMAFEAQIDKLVEKLTELTRADKVGWQETAAENTFLTGVGKSVVTVGRLRTGTDAPCFIRILDATGKTVIEEAFAPMPGDSSLQDWDRLRNLHELARRSALKSEKVVSDLLSSLEAIR